MPVDNDPRAELESLAARFRHLRAEHARAHEGSGVRRRIESDMRETEDKLERRLAALVDDEDVRAAWRDHAHHGGPAPEHPPAAEPGPAPPEPPERPEGRRPWPR
jgi:hypothetical protein